MKLHITNHLLFFPIYFLLFLLPFLPLLSEFFLIRVFDNYTLIGFIKEVLIFLFIFNCFSVLIIRKNLFLKVDVVSLTILAFFIYGLAHILITEASVRNSINNFRLIYLNQLLSVMLILLFINLRKKPNIDLTFIIIFISAVFVSLFGLYEKLFNPDIINLYKLNFDSVEKNTGIVGFPRVRIVSTLGNPINLSMFMVVGIIALIYLKSVGILRSNFILIFFYILFITILLMTLSRTGYLSLLGVFLMYMSMIFFSNKKLLLYYILIIGLFALLLYYIIVNNDLLLYRVQQMIDFEYVSKNEPRLENWSYLLSILLKDKVYLMWGLGLGNAGTSGLEGNKTIVENSFIAILYELGFIGLIFFLRIIYLFSKNSVIIIKDSIHYKDKILGWAALMYLVAFLLSSLFMDSYLNNPFNFYFWLFLGLVTIKSVEVKNK